MMAFILTFTILNFIGLIIAGVLFFKERYVIVPLEEWNMIAHVYNHCATEGMIDEEGNFLTESVQELAGGTGFFKEEIPDVYYEEEEEE